MTELYSKPIPQISWHLQSREKFVNSKRPIDKMSTAEIGRMYQEGRFLCDSCGKKLGECNLTLQEHIFHLINPMILWSCDDCLLEDWNKGRLIAMKGREIEK